MLRAFKVFFEFMLVVVKQKCPPQSFFAESLCLLLAHVLNPCALALAQAGTPATAAAILEES